MKIKLFVTSLDMDMFIDSCYSYVEASPVRSSEMDIEVEVDLEKYSLIKNDDYTYVIKKK